MMSITKQNGKYCSFLSWNWILNRIYGTFFIYIQNMWYLSTRPFINIYIDRHKTYFIYVVQELLREHISWDYIFIEILNKKLISFYVVLMSILYSES